jgi:endo-1,4-beta-xylanase
MRLALLIMNRNFLGIGIRILSVSGFFLMGLLFATPPSTAQQICTNQSGTQDGFYYELWKDGNGSACMTLKSGCEFSCSWSNARNMLARRGLKYDETRRHQQIGTFNATYACNYNPSGNSYLGVYGWTVNPLVEYYIVESWGTWRPPGAASKGTVTIDGGTYDIYEATQNQKPSVKGIQTFKQFWSVRTSKRSGGTISISEHFNAWEGKGMTMGKMYDINLVVEGYRSSGNADFTNANVWVSSGKK